VGAANARRGLAEIEAQIGATEDAKAHITELLAEFGTSDAATVVNALLTLGGIEERRRDVKAARAAYLSALRLDPNPAPSTRAAVYQGLGSASAAHAPRRSRMLLDLARSIYAEQGGAYGLAMACIGIAELASRAGEVEAFRAAVDQASDAAERSSAPALVQRVASLRASLDPTRG
jgi:tetratricopeptide (TPR) repeat protein